MRAEVSDGPPGGNGVTRMILWPGYPWAKAHGASAMSASATINLFTASLPFRSSFFLSLNRQTRLLARECATNGNDSAPGCRIVTIQSGELPARQAPDDRGTIPRARLQTLQPV